MALARDSSSRPTIHQALHGSSRLRRWLPGAAVLGVVGMAASPASAQWTVVNLTPAAATGHISLNGVQGGQQVGGAIVGASFHASLWSGTAVSWVDLHPAGSTYSYAYGIQDGLQVGVAVVGGIQHASMWSGTAASWVDLHPAAASESGCLGMDGAQQVGFAASGGGFRHASLWSGTAASWVDLDPAGTIGSYGQGVDGGQQVGNAWVGGVDSACLWSGTAASRVDLNPFGATQSEAHGVQGGRQVGYADLGGIQRAGMWSGTASSWLDLNPAWATRSSAYGVHGGQQVGYVAVGGVDHAALWSGTADSWVDLGTFLPPGFTYSYAAAIWADGSFATYVAGYGFNSTTNRQEALMWVSCAPAIADAGPDQAVTEGVSVTLDASASLGPCGNSPSVTWAQIAGPPVCLDLSDPLRPAFLAPEVARGGATLTFRLTVDNGSAAPVSESVNITVSNVNHPPQAAAGPGQVVAEGSPVMLDGSQSFDPDGDPLLFDWIQVAGPSVALDLSDPSRPTFIAPLVGSAGAVLTFSLTVSDGIDLGVDTVDVAVENVNHAPVAEAGPDAAVDMGSHVTLDASASNDPDADPLDFAWQQVSGPAVALTDALTPNPGFTAPAVGPTGTTLIFRVTVSDGLVWSSDDVSIQVEHLGSPPNCAAARPSIEVLWPPDHKLIPVKIFGVNGGDGGAVTITIVSVMQDEPVNGLGDGDTSPDAVMQGDTVLLRAERGESRNGRVYHVTFGANNAAGQTIGQVTVRVPHDRRPGTACVDDGPRYNSVAP